MMVAKKIIETVTGLSIGAAGIVILWHNFGFLAALGVYLCIFGNNFGYAKNGGG